MGHVGRVNGLVWAGGCASPGLIPYGVWGLNLWIQSLQCLGLSTPTIPMGIVVGAYVVRVPFPYGGLAVAVRATSPHVSHGKRVVIGRDPSVPCPRTGLLIFLAFISRFVRDGLVSS